MRCPILPNCPPKWVSPGPLGRGYLGRLVSQSTTRPGPTTVIRRLLLRCVAALLCRDARPELLGDARNHYLLQRWTQADGLPVNALLSAALDPDGFLWLATGDGLVRFDGDRFEVFNTANTPILPGNRLHNLRLDAEGRLWAQTLEREHVVYYRAGRFRTFAHPTGGQCAALLVAPEGVWLSAADGIYRFDGTTFVRRHAKSVAGCVKLHRSRKTGHEAPCCGRCPRHAAGGAAPACQHARLADARAALGRHFTGAPTPWPSS